MAEWTVIDLAMITDTLVGLLNTAIANSPVWTEQVNGQTIPKFTIDVNGAMPEAVRDESSCVLSVYLLHVGRDPHWRNTPPAGALARTNPAQPLSLNLSYLISAYANKDFRQEQQAMSIALNCFHQNAIYHDQNMEFTITVEADTIDEMSRLWQAITAPIRLSTLFRVAVVFLKPSAAPPTSHPPPSKALTFAVGGSLDSQPAPQLFQVATTVSWLIPSGATDPESVVGSFSRPVVVGGASLRVGGQLLDQPTAASVYLTAGANGPEWPIAAWRAPPVPPATSVSAEELTLSFPAAYAALPGPGVALTGTPPPGIYFLTVGPSGAGQRSPPLPLTVAPRIDGVATPPALAPSAGVYTLHGAGFTANATQVLLNDVLLTSASTGGAVTIDAAGATITFSLPTAPPLPTGRYFVRVRVNGVEAPPSWWVDAP